MLLLTKTKEEEKEEEEENIADDDLVVSGHFYMRWDHKSHHCKENLTLFQIYLTRILD